MRKAAVTCFFLIACVAGARAPLADSVSYQILMETTLSDCALGAGSGAYTVVATLNLSAPASALKVSVDEACPAVTHDWNYPTSGDPLSDLTIDFGGCISGSVELFTAHVEYDEGNSCCPAIFRGPGGYFPSITDPPILVGCGGEERFLIPPCSAPAPQLQSPADGASGVSLSPLLSWTWGPGDYCQEGIGLSVFSIRYGTDPSNLDQTLNTLDTMQGTLPTLQATTQYYWRVRVFDDFYFYTGSPVNYSDVRTFTTGADIPVEHRTWGAIKSLYKDEPND